ncbi:hypothetical protein RM844_30295 [Streptomyces sp. DSM 44915]|uniref:Uncharacterized protein n=1 Tax=Streptomyces chisholmiae TaxID=3075540 RepID=A0ABU2K046_9ACTN|nr:hypothetical protein [Streptomyces sp. DSM 44915]MDT0270572.1 hypothetical protein [Streptomyces sp. DSM 44915]
MAALAEPASVLRIVIIQPGRPEGSLPPGVMVGHGAELVAVAWLVQQHAA